MRQPVVTENEQAPVLSLQESPVHERPSEHVVPVAHTPEPLHRPQPAGAPSSQRAPTRALQAVVLIAGSQTWHEFAGFTVPIA